jgi:hypothetical protein
MAKIHDKGDAYAMQEKTSNTTPAAERSAVLLNDALVEKMLSVLQGQTQDNVLAAANRLVNIVSCYCRPGSGERFQVTVFYVPQVPSELAGIHCDEPSQISVHRPFYLNGRYKEGRRKQELLRGHGVSFLEPLLRRCDAGGRRSSTTIRDCSLPARDLRVS